MTGEAFLNGKVTLLRGDCLELLPTLGEGSIDSCVTDPPYHLTSIVKRFGSPNAAECQHGTDGAYARASKGFMGKQWDGGDIAFRPELWAEVLRVLKPGAHLLAFSGTRTYHRMACAIEDAGFEVRDQIQWVYGSGFPKSHNLGEGWGTALKPANEPIVLARKPLSESSIAANVLKHGTGGINVDGCRIEAEVQTGWGGKAAGGNTWNGDNCGLAKDGEARPANGRWPANLIHDGSEEVVSGFPESGPSLGVKPGSYSQGMTKGNVNDGWRRPAHEHYKEKIGGHNDSGSAARFFYTAKADSDDRLGSKHPTVKPVDLIRYLVRLVTPPNGTILDPFAGTGTTGEASFYEGFQAVLIEREEEYQADIVRRMGLCLAGPDERLRETIKASGKVEDAGPLFGGVT
jgi:site-specific DNA-methyltransferase (adenine-specific)